MPFTPPTTAISQATTGYLAQLFLGVAGSPPTYTAVSELKSFSAPYVDVPEVNVTHLLSPNSTEEIRAGLLKPGKVEITGNFIGDTAQLALLTAAQNAAAHNPSTQPMKIVAPIQGTKTYTATFNGYVSKYEVGPFENNKAVDFKASIQITDSIVEGVV